ncbi:MAG: transaldolase [Chloroflexi bacterium]|nr:transaldolase [Chloroflexota bacterium]
MTNYLRELKKFGQSVWLDNIRRGLITSGELQRLVDEDGLSGVTANPSIFEKAIAHSSDYDDILSAKSGRTAEEVYETIAFEDVGMAADVLRPVYDQTRGGDGYVSIEVLASLANDTQGSIRDAKRYWQTLNRPNIMVKIPATLEGLPAIEQSLCNGINVNITLIFSIERYLAVAEAYVRALEQRAEKGERVDQIASVASFFVSRVDSLADKLIEQKLSTAGDSAQKQTLQSLLGKVAIANSKVAYQHYKRIFEGERFAKLRAKGARPQRVLWASTSTKNPNYPDTYYVDELIGPETVNTIPPETMDKFREHGHVRASLEENVEEAYATLKRLADVGISLDEITRQLEIEGIKQFDDAFIKLLQEIGEKQKQKREEPQPVPGD